jgi:Dynamin family
MNELDRLRADVLDTFRDVLREIDKDLSDTRRRLVDTAQEKLSAGRYFLVVFGEFRRGKSSLLNALTDRPGLFPVNVSVTTCAVSTLQWGPDEGAIVYFAEDVGDPARTAEPVSISLAEAADYVTEQGNPHNIKNVARIEMRAPVPLLKSGLVLVDTPGLGSINPEHTTATHAYVPNADAILFVAAATEQISQVELDSLAWALPQCPIVVTAITMIDRVIDPVPSIAEARRRIGDTSRTDPADLVLVGVSSSRKHKAVQSEDAELLAESGFPELEQHLWHGLAITCGREQIRDALDALGAALADVAAPVANALAALQDDSALRKVEADLREAQDLTRELRSKTSRWRQDLKDQLEIAVRPVRARMSQDFDEASERFRRALDAERTVSDPSSLIRDISEALVDAANRAKRGLDREAMRIADQFSAETATRITASNVSPAFQPAIHEVPSVQSTRGPSKWFKFRSSWGGSTAGGQAGALVGGLAGFIVPVVGPLLGAFLGGVVGQVLGGFGGARETERIRQQRAREDQIAHLRTEVTGMISASTRDAERNFGSQVIDYSRAMIRSLDDQIDARAASLQESVRRLDELRRQTAEKRAAQLAPLTELAARYLAHQARLEGLTTRADNLGTTL